MRVYYCCECGLTYRYEVAMCICGATVAHREDHRGDPVEQSIVNSACVERELREIEHLMRSNRGVEVG